MLTKSATPSPNYAWPQYGAYVNVTIHNNHYLAYIYLMYRPHFYFFIYKF